MSVKKPLEGFAKTADHIVGDLVLGTIGRVAFHVAQIPVVGEGLKYVGENVKDGYEAASEAGLRKKLANAVVKIARETGKPVGSETIRSMAREYGVSDASLEDVRKIVEREMAPKKEKAQGAFPTPASAGSAA